MSYDRSSTAEGSLANHAHVLLLIRTMKGFEMNVEVMPKKVNDVGSMRHIGTSWTGMRARLRLEATDAVVIGTLDQVVLGCTGVKFDLLYAMELAKVGDKRSPVGIMGLENDAAISAIRRSIMDGADVLDEVVSHNCSSSLDRSTGRHNAFCRRCYREITCS